MNTPNLDEQLSWLEPGQMLNPHKRRELRRSIERLRSLLVYHFDQEELVSGRERVEGVPEVGDTVPDPAWWTCYVGPIPRNRLPEGCDLPMRTAVSNAFSGLFGEYPETLGSGWGEPVVLPGNGEEQQT